MTRRRNLIVASLGRKNMGKSELLWELFTSQAPRVLSIDPMGESIERDPMAIEVVGWGNLMDALAAAERFQRWHIAATIEQEDVAELFTLLAPPFGSGKPSLSLAFHGMAIECGEAYEVAPNGATPPEILAGWRRGRHYMLDLYMAAQRPSSVAREVTALADRIYAFAQTEPRDLKFLSDTISAPVADRVRRLKQWECVYYNRDDGTANVLAPDRRVTERLNTMGDQLTLGP